MRRRTSHFSIGCLFWILAAAVPEALDADSDIAGSAKDRTGGALVGARVLVLTPERAVIATTTTDATGRFVIRNLRDGRYVILAQYPPLLDRQVIVTIPSARPIVLDL